MPAIVLYLKYLNIPILNLVYFLFFSSLKRSNDSTRIIITAIMGIAFGFFVGISISSVHLTKVIFTMVILFNALSHVFHPYNFFPCYILQISLLSSSVACREFFWCTCSWFWNRQIFGWSKEIFCCYWRVFWNQKSWNPRVN